MTTKLSLDTITNDEHNGSFEDESLDDENSNAIDHSDSLYQPQINGGVIRKAYALYDFTGKNHLRNHRFHFVNSFQQQVTVLMAVST